jgi:hypothetical protein
MADNEELKDSVSLTNELVDNTKELGRLYKQNKENIGGLDSALSNMLSNSKGLNKQFENLTGLSDRLERLEIKKNKIQDISNNLAAKRKIIENNRIKLSETELQQQKDIATQATESYKEVLEQIKEIEENKSYLNRKEREAQQRELKNLLEIKKIRGEEKDLRQEVVDALQNQIKLQDEALEATDREVAALEEYEKKYDNITLKLGLTGRLLKGLQKVPLVGDLINAEGALEAMRKELNTLNGGSGSSVAALGKGFKAAFEGIDKASIMLAAITAIVMAFRELMKIGFEVSRQVTEIGKSMALSTDNAELLRNDFIAIQNSSDNIFVTTKNLVEAQTQLQEATGTTVRFTEDQLKSQLLLTKQYGLSAELAGDLQNIAIFNDQTAEQTTDSVIKQTSSFARQKGIQLDNRKVFGEITKISGQLRLNLHNNAEEMTKAVLLSKQYGINLEQAKNIAGGLLDFDTSISAELEAELLTGKQLNLEQARYLALTGKTAEAAADVLKQVGSSQQFSKLNVIAQQAFAQAVGLSVDELSDSLIQQENLSKLGKQNRQLVEDRVKALREEGRVDEANKLMKSIGNEDDAKAALAKIDAQTKFNESIEKLKSLLASIVEGPAFRLVEMFADLASFLTQNKIILATLVGLMTAYAAAAAVASIASTFGLAAGPIMLASAAAVGGLTGLIGSAVSLSKVNDGIINSDGGLVVSGPKGAYSLNKDDKVFASPNIDKPGTSSNSGASSNSGTSSNLGVSSDLIVRKLDELINVIKQGGDVILDGNKVGQALVLSNYRMQ